MVGLGVPPLLAPPPQAVISAAATPADKIRIALQSMVGSLFGYLYSEQQRSIAARVDKESRR
jgi:hypothetical protein